MQQTGNTYSLSKKLRKSILDKSWRPLVKYYLRKPREFSYEGINIKVNNGVFHPGLFYSTGYLLEYLKNQDLRDKKFLELGCGSGLISMFAGKNGANVTATDISSNAVNNANYNASINDVKIEVLHSDLFDKIPLHKFDYIIINPPYYPSMPEKEEDYAWNCGSDFEYFQKLFLQLPKFIHSDSKVIMVLSEDCKIETIAGLAEVHELDFTEIGKKKIFLEWNFLFQITSKNKLLQ